MFPRRPPLSPVAHAPGRPPASWGSYPARVDGAPRFEPEPWGEDRALVELLGEQGAAGFRALLDGFPGGRRRPVGASRRGRADRGLRVRLWQPVDAAGLPDPAGDARSYTLLEALPPMRGSRAFDAYADVCETGAPFVNEITYDTPFGDGYMLGTFLHRVAKLGDGLVVFLHRRHRGAADGGRAARRTRTSSPTTSASPSRASRVLVTPARAARLSSRRRRGAPRAPGAATERARELIDGVLDYARSGELARERSRSDD